MTVKLGHDIWEMTSAMTLDRITQTGQSGQVGLTGQPGQLRKDRTERTGWQEMTTRTGLRGQVNCGQERWSRTAGTGQPGQDR
jgi:hypothetical protein